LGPELLKGHAAVGLSNKCRGKVWRQNNDFARSGALASSVVGNGGNVVNTGSQGGVGRMVSVGANGNMCTVGVRQATKGIIRQNKRNNTFFRILQEHDHFVIGGAGDASNAAAKSGRRTKENGSGVFIGDDSTKSGERVWVA